MTTAEKIKEGCGKKFDVDSEYDDNYCVCQKDGLCPTCQAKLSTENFDEGLTRVAPEGEFKSMITAEKKICIVAFSDVESNSLAYKKFDDIDKAVEFYKSQLLKDDVNVISTRKTIVK